MKAFASPLLDPGKKFSDDQVEEAFKRMKTRRGVASTCKKLAQRIGELETDEKKYNDIIEREDANVERLQEQWDKQQDKLMKKTSSPQSVRDRIQADLNSLDKRAEAANDKIVAAEKALEDIPDAVSELENRLEIGQGVWFDRAKLSKIYHKVRHPFKGMDGVNPPGEPKSLKWYDGMPKIKGLIKVSKYVVLPAVALLTVLGLVTDDSSSSKDVNDPSHLPGVDESGEQIACPTTLSANDGVEAARRVLHANAVGDDYNDPAVLDSYTAEDLDAVNIDAGYGIRLDAGAQLPSSDLFDTDQPELNQALASYLATKAGAIGCDTGASFAPGRQVIVDAGNALLEQANQSPEAVPTTQAPTTIEGETPSTSVVPTTPNVPTTATPTTVNERGQVTVICEGDTITDMEVGPAVGVNPFDVGDPCPAPADTPSHVVVEGRGR